MILHLKNHILQKLDGMPKEFYESILVPLIGKCADGQFGIDLEEHAMKQKEQLCEAVKNMNKLFIKLNNQYEWAKSGQMARISFTLKIHNVIYDDLKKVKSAHRSSGYWRIAKEIHDIAKPKAENLTTAFKETLNAFKTSEVDKGESNKLLYKLLCIGYEMNDYLGKVGITNEYGNKESIAEIMAWARSQDDNTWEEVRAWALFENKKCFEEIMAWAFQQFAANLFFYSLHLDQQSISLPGAKGDIKEIAEAWPIGMPDTSTTQGHEGHVLSAQLISRRFNMPPKDHTKI